MKRSHLPLAAVAVALLVSGCTTFSDNNAVARVDDVELSEDEFREQLRVAGAPEGEVLSGDALRGQITQWIRSELLDPEAVAMTYGRGLADAGVVCFEALVVDAPEAAEAAADRLRGGESFAPLFDEVNIEPSLDSVRGRFGCVPGTQLQRDSGDPFIDSLYALSDENPVVTAPLQDELDATIGHVVARFIPHGELGPEELPIVEANVDASTLEGDVYVDPRYGVFDTDTGSVVALG